MRAICVIGVGYVGLVTGTCFADQGHQVTCVDVDEAKIEKLCRGVMPIYEPGLEEMVRRNSLAGRLRFTMSYADGLAGAEFAFIAVGTPQGSGGQADLAALDGALYRLPPSMPVIIRSTVPPGTTDRVAKDRIAVHVPEFMQERPDGAWREPGDVPFMILGGSEQAREFFLPVLLRLACPVVFIARCTAIEAELVKYTANCWLAVQVTFANEMARVCAAAGAGWERVREAWLEDPRASASHTKVEGPGFGGRCLPKDLSALIAASREAGYDPGFLRAVQDANGRFQAEAS